MPRTVIRSDHLRRLRALAMIDRKIHGASYADLAREFQMSEIHVGRVLAWAEKAGLVATAEDKILEDLVPEAIAAVKRCLAPRLDSKGNPLPVGDKEAAIALRVLEGALPGFGNKKSTGNGTKVTEDDDLYSYVDKIRQGLLVDAERTEHPILEGHVAGCLPPAATSADEEGLPASTEGVGGIDGSNADSKDSTRSE